MNPGDNTIGGYYADKATMLGPSAATVNSQNPGAVETPGRGVMSDAPIYGPTRGKGGLPTPKQFINSPAGLTLTLGFLAYIGFRYVFA